MDDGVYDCFEKIRKVIGENLNRTIELIKAEERWNFQQHFLAAQRQVLYLQDLSRLPLEEAFEKALSLRDVATVSWICRQVDLKALFATTPLPLSQGVLLSLTQQLSWDLRNDTAHKLKWIREGALALNPKDPVVTPHIRPFLEQLYQNLHWQMHQLTIPNSELANFMRHVLHVVNSVLTSSK